jgi:hypothetical protein
MVYRPNKRVPAEELAAFAKQAAVIADRLTRA